MSNITTTQSRPNDFIYDPNYIMSGPKDFFKQAYNAKLSTAKYAICPIFPTMFSDLRNYPRKQYVMRKSRSNPQYIDKVHELSKLNLKQSRSILIGQDRHKYFHNPVQITVPHLDMSCFYSVDTDKKMKEIIQTKKGSKNVKMQTMFRDSSAQTSPWEPNYKVVQGDPELLKLDFLKWGAGLPAEIHEVTLIERARMKRQWEKSMPPATDTKSFNERRTFIEAIARDEWSFREQEIQDIQDLRLELLEKMLSELHNQTKCRTQKKMRMFIDLKLNERNDKINQLHKDTNRELRRLEFNYKGILSKYGHVNVYDEHSDFKSELYIPLMRHGTNPKYGHQVLNESMKKYKSQYCGVEEYNTLPNWLDQPRDLKDIKLPGTRLCIRETKWTTPVLKTLHEELKNLRNLEKKCPNLRVALFKEESEIPTPQVEDCNDEAHILNENCVFLQKILRGRAAQLTIFEGRERCRELIDELRSSFPLLRCTSVKQVNEKKETQQNQRDAMWCKKNVLESSLKKMGGYVTGTLLDFLNKEWKRLIGERKINAIVLMIERERMKREAEEAGRRQLELRKRKEHDEIFKQVVKVHQDSVDLYLQDIITQGMNFASENEAEEYVKKLAKKIDHEANNIEKKLDDITYKEEYVADLVHHFVIPEVEKTIVRQRNKNEQKKYLKAAHDEMYNTLDNIQSTSISHPSSSSELTEVNIIDYEALRQKQKQEKKMVLSDINSILTELIRFPGKQATLRDAHSCHDNVDEVLDEYSSSSSEIMPESPSKSLRSEYLPIEEEEVQTTLNDDASTIDK